MDSGAEVNLLVVSVSEHDITMILVLHFLPMNGQIVLTLQYFT